jgi:predicted acyl esterase
VRNFKASFAAALAILTVACTGSEPADPDVADPAKAVEASCKHPYPCGNEWPADLTGPFELADVQEVTVTAEDGTELSGWIASPTVPPGTRTPTILSSSPYYDGTLVVPGAVYRNPTTPLAVPEGGVTGWWDEATPLPLDVNTHSAGFPPIRLIRRGYTLAYFSARGTGNSTGCFDGGGDLDQDDQRTIIDWIAAQKWSNGRVGMVGLSAPSRHSWQAAVEAPAALKAIVTAGDLIDIYQWVYTPQGSRSVVQDAFYTNWTGELSLDGGLNRGRLGILDRVGCGALDFGMQEAASLITGDRNAPYWEARTVAGRLDQVTAAVLDTSGYLDLGHSMQDSTIWGALPKKTPKVQYRGWWGHNHPTSWNGWGTKLDMPSGEQDWEAVVTQWFDYWLKGIGPKPRTDVVYHQDQNLRWHEAGNWSPEPSKREVLYLASSGLEVDPIAGDVTFRSAPSALDFEWSGHALGLQTGTPLDADDAGIQHSLCAGAADPNVSHVYTTPPVAAASLIAGNPHAYLTLSSDMAGGVVTVTLFDIAPTFACTGADATGTGAHATGARYIASGSADLNFYTTPYLAYPFRVDTPTEVRIDLSDITYAMAPGHRLAVVLSHGEPGERSGTLVYPNITVHGVRSGTDPARASHIVIPVAEGTIGGHAPTLDYPQRPFTPDHYRD